MHIFAPLFTLLLLNLQQPSIIPLALTLREQNPTLLKSLPNSRNPVRLPVSMPFWSIYGRDGAVVKGRDVTAWEDVGGWKSGGGADAVEEEDLVCGGYEEDTGD